MIAKGWTALTQTISGDELIWKVEDEGMYMPDIYPTEKDVWKSIAEDQIQMMQQFIDDEREQDEVDWEPQSYPVQIEIEDGIITCYEVSHTMVSKEHSQERKHEVLKIPLKEWQEAI